MRAFGLSFSGAITLSILIGAAGCSAPPAGLGGATASASSTGAKKSKGSSKTSKTTDDSASSTSGDDDDDATNANATTGSDDTTAAAPASKFACSGAGIAAYADALVKATRKSCTSHGTGVVRNDNYACAKTAIDSVGPAHPDKSYEIVTTLLAPNKEFPNLECTYFIQMVTSGVCGTPLSPSNMAWTDYPLAHEFIDKAPAGWTWFANNGTTPVQAGDIFVYDTTGGQDPGHIMIVAEVMSGNKFRIAEANELNADGSAATGETGVTSNTRVTTQNDPAQRPAGWFRLAAK